MNRNQPVCRYFFGGFRNVRNCMVRYYHQYSLWEVLFFLSSVMFILFWILVHVLTKSFEGQARYFYDTFYHLRNLLMALGIGALLYLATVYLPRLGQVPKVIANGVVVMMFLCTLLVFVIMMTLMVESALATTAYFSAVDSETMLVGRIIDSYRFAGNGEVLPHDLTKLDAWDFNRLMEDHLLCLLAYRYGSWLVVLLSIIAGVWTVSAIFVYLKLYSRWFEWVFLTSFCSAAYQIITPILYTTGLLSGSYSIMDPFYACDVTTICVFLTIPLSAMLVVTKRNHDAI